MPARVCVCVCLYLSADPSFEHFQVGSRQGQRLARTTRFFLLLDYLYMFIVSSAGCNVSLIEEECDGGEEEEHLNLNLNPGAGGFEE